MYEILVKLSRTYLAADQPESAVSTCQKIIELGAFADSNGLPVWTMLCKALVLTFERSKSQDDLVRFSSFLDAVVELLNVHFNSDR